MFRLFFAFSIFVSTKSTFLSNFVYLLNKNEKQSACSWSLIYIVANKFYEFYSIDKTLVRRYHVA